MNFFTLASCTTLSVLCKSFQRTLSINLAAPRQLKQVSLRSTCTSFLFSFLRTLFNLVLLEVSFVLESGCKGITFLLNSKTFGEKSLLFVAILTVVYTFVSVHIIYNTHKSKIDYIQKQKPQSHTRGMQLRFHYWIMLLCLIIQR